MAPSRPFKEYRLALPLFTPLILTHYVTLHNITLQDEVGVGVRGDPGGKGGGGGRQKRD